MNYDICKFEKRVLVGVVYVIKPYASVSIRQQNPTQSVLQATSSDQLCTANRCRYQRELSNTSEHKGIDGKAMLSISQSV